MHVHVCVLYKNPVLVSKVYFEEPCVTILKIELMYEFVIQLLICMFSLFIQGQTAMDIVDPDIEEVLQELKEKQALVSHHTRNLQTHNPIELRYNLNS